MTDGSNLSPPRGRGASRGLPVARRAAADAVRALTSLPVVDLTVDGVAMLAAFQPDDHEHRRRTALDVGAVTSTGLLHGLWLLPSGLPVPIDEVPDHKRRHLDAAPNLVDVTDAGYQRRYSPPGVVRAVAFGGSRIGRTLQRAARFTPIVQRFVYSEGPMRPSAARVSEAVDAGVGLLECVASNARLLLEPSPAEVGVPAVYRWWIAELAYENWIYESAQPVS
ncbi:MAG: hypothetical protein ABIX10_06735 [Acidimicrobiales bacterium]